MAGRVDLAMQQRQVMREVFKEAVLFFHDLRVDEAELSAVISRFEGIHVQLRDGDGHGIPGIMMPERDDLMRQWERVDAAWHDAKAKVHELPALRMAVDHLDEELLVIIPLYAIEDVEAPDRFPWSLVVYSSIAAAIVTCCCFTVLIPVARHRRAKAKEALQAIPDEV